MFLIKNDFGIDILLNAIDQDCAVVDLSAATEVEFEFRKPDGSIVTKTAAFVTDGTDGKCRYSVESGLLDVAGTWTVRLLVTEGATSQYRSLEVAFAVKN